jgi:hypothetical protein
MKNKQTTTKKKSIFFLALFVLVAMMTASVFAELPNQPVEQENLLSTESVVQFSNETNEQYDKLTAYWGDSLPSYYAGAYLKDFKFYILVTCSPSSIEETIWNVTGNPNVVVKQVKYSYDYLVDIRDELVTTIRELSNDSVTNADLFVGFGVDEINNRVFVEVMDNGNIDKNTIYSMINYDDLVNVIFKAKAYKPKTDDINAGSKDWVVNTDDGDTMSTIGFCGSRVNSSSVTEYGFMIAGHAGSLYDEMEIDSTTVGTVAARAYSGQMDAAFVNLDIASSFVRSDKLSTSYTIDSSANVGIVGTSYTMHGMSSGIISGTVNNTSFSFVMDSINFSNFIRMEMDTAAGDSGGPLVKQNAGYSRSVIGILSGGDDTYANFTKFSVISNAFDLTLY